MRYERQFQRQHERTYVQIEKKQVLNRELTKKVLSAFTVLSFIANPFAAVASEIVRQDGTKETFNNNIADIYANQMINGNKTGVNKFSKFDVSANDIANMYFNQQGKNIYADNLVNLVGSKINIGGTVNAIKQNKIGGNLFFLSSDGMAVTDQGVINAGTLTVLTPNQNTMNEFMQAGNESKINEMVANPSSVALNKSGTITVAGTINTTNGMNLRTGHTIDITKNGTLRSGVDDFAQFGKMVNIKDEKNKVIVSDLKATQAPNSGDIILSVDASEMNHKDDDFNKTLANGLGITDDNTVEAKITQNGTIDGAGDVVLAANATSEKQRVAQTVSQIDVNGKIKGKTVDIAATSKNVFEDDGKWDNLKEVPVKTLGSVSANLDADYAVLKGKANVNINEGSVVEATGSDVKDKDGKITQKAVRIHADSTVGTQVGAKLSPFKLGNVGNSNAVPATAVAYVQTDNDASTTVNGTIKSKDSTEISADANSEIVANASTKTEIEQGNPNLVNAAVLVVNGKNTSHVTVGQNANLQKDSDGNVNLEGNVDIHSKTTNSLEAKVSTSAKDKSALATAVNVTNYASDAQTSVQAGVTAGKDLAVRADNIVEKNTVITNNGIGSSFSIKSALKDKFMHSKTFNQLFDVKNENSFISQAIKEFGSLGTVGKKFQDGILSPTSGKFDDIGKTVSIGGAVQYVDEQNTSKVKIGAVPLKAGGDATLAAKTDIQDTRMNVISQTHNSKDDSQIKGAVSAAVLYSEMDNTSAVVVEGGSDTKHADISGTNVAVTATTTMPYNRVKKLIEELNKAVQDVKDYYAGKPFSESKDYQDNIKAIEAAARDFESVSSDGDVGDKFTALSNAFINLRNAIDTLANRIDKDGSQVPDAILVPYAVLKKTIQFTGTDQYANFYVRTMAKDGADENTKLTVAGSVNINSVVNNSNVLIGKNAAITATKKATVASSTKGETVSFTGNASKFLLPGKANSDGGGASVAFEQFGGNSATIVAEGAVVRGADVAIDANNSLNRTGIIFTAGRAGEYGQSEMVDIITGDSNALTLVDDEAVVDAKKAADITASNNTVLTNVSGAFMKSESAAIGVGAAVNLYDTNTIAGIVDTDGGIDTTLKTGDLSLRDESDNKIKNAQKLSANLLGLSNDEKNSYLGDSKTNKEGEIKAHKVDINSTATGTINSVAVAGAVSKSDDSGEEGFFDRLGKAFDGLQKKVTDPLNKGFDKLDNAVSGKIDETGFTVSDAMNSGGASQGASQNNEPGGKNEQSMKSLVNIGGAGSVAVNIVNGQTSALTDGAKITLDADGDKKENGSFSSTAADDVFIGSWGGAAAVNWVTAKNNSNTSVGIGGTAAANNINRDVASIIRNTSITNAGSITNSATKEGALVASGLGMAVSKVSGQGAGTNVAGSVGVSYNNSDSDVHALLIDNQVQTDNNAKTVITNSATNSDVQVTGGVSASVAAGGKSGYGAGGSIVIGTLKNDVESGMLGGTYKNISSIENDAVLGTKQIGAGLGLAVSTSDSGGTFSGVGIYNALDNTAHALIDGASITASGPVSAEAYDTNDTNKHESYIANRGLDATGASYKEAVAYDERDGKLDDTEDYYKKLNDGMAKKDKDGGNTIVTGALAVSGSGGKGGIGAAVAIDDIKNTITSTISNANITADTVKSDADTDTVLVGVAAGGAGSNKFGGVGSVSWQMVDSAAKATISSSKLNANAVSANAVNDVLGVNVAGQVSAGKTAVGMALAYHGLENQTGAYIKGTDITAKDNEKGVAVTVQADNKSQIVSVGAGVGAATGAAAVNGSVAINRGSNSTEAVIDQDENGKRSTIKKAKNVTVATTDATTTTAIAGGVTISKNVAVGGAVAYNEVGELSSLDNAKKQQQQAVINNTDITTAEKAAIQVSATDKSKLTTVGAGIGIGAGQTGVAVQGAAATALVNKNAEASMTNTNIDKDEEDAAKADVSVAADSDSTIVSNASVVAVGTTGAAIGAGVAVNRIEQATTGAINGGTMHVDNAAVMARSNTNIMDIGIGGSVAGKGAAVTGNVAVNTIDNDVTAHIGQGANITANRNVGIIATSDDVISNYAGTLSIAGQGAGVGISTSVNEITGSTQATVGDENDDKTKVIAKGNGDGLKTNTAVGDNEINDTLIDRNTIDINAKINRTDETRKGIIVDATATHTTKSFLANAAIAGQGAGVAPTVNVNTLGGDTMAKVKNAILNGGAADTDRGDVTVTAADYANSSGFVGTVGVAGQGAGIGLGSDTNTISRTVAATIEKSDVKADNLAVDADSKQGISSYTIGAAAAGQGAGVAGVVNVTKLDNATKAAILDSTANAGSVAVKANHKGIVNAGDFSVGVAGMGAGVGASVGVVKDESTTEATIGQTKDKTKVDADTSITVNATNETVTKPKLSANGVGIVGAGAGGAISVNNMNSTVKANVINAHLQAKNQGIDVKADNTFTMDSYLGSNAAGAGGIGASVSVNTIDSTVQTNVSGSTLTAGGDIDLGAVETRNITQVSTNAQAGIGALGANIALTTVGKTVEDKDALAAIAKANGAYGNDNLLANGVVSGALQDSGTSADIVKPTVDAETGGKGSQITVNVAASDLQAKQTVSADAKEQGDIHMTLGGGSLGAIAANAGVGKLDINRNVAVNLSGGTQVSGQKIALGTDVTSKAVMNVYQGSAGLLGVNAALGEAKTAGNSVVTIGDTTLSSSDIDILAQDNSQTEANTLGITVGGVTVGVIGATAKNQSNTIVDIKSSSFGKENADANINIGTNKNNNVTAHATGGSGGVVSGTGVIATAEDSGESSITLGNKGQDSKKNTFTGQKLTLSAATSPAVKAIADSISASLLAGGAGATAAAKTTGSVGVTVYDGNELKVDEANITANASSQKDKKNTEAYVEGNSGAGGVNTSSNTATATTDLDVNVAIGAIKGKEKTTEIVESTTWDEQGNKVEKKKEVTTGLTALNIQGQNSIKTAADARGITVGGVFASGNNKAVTENTSDTTISYQAGTTETKLGSLTVGASGAGDNLVTADGSGGGLISADQAAYVKNTMNSTVTAAVSGSVLVNGDVSVRAAQNDTANLHADALKATAIGMSGTKAENSITGSTDVNLNDLNLVSAGAVDVDAANTVTLGNTEQYAVEGSGYGGIAGQSANFSNTITKDATVNVGNGKLKSYGKQALEAKSEGNINAGGYIKAAGAGASTWVDVDNQVTSNNAVKVGEGGSLETVGSEGDITLAAVDNMDITARAVADTQGGAAGGASADVTNTLQRNNQININGSLYSRRDLNLYAGKDSDGDNGKLNLNVESEAYNKTLLAVAKPKLKDEISQNNNVTLGNKAAGNSVRNINLYADAGDETIRDTAIKYTWYDSDKDENYTSSTVGNKAPDNKTSNNYVQVDGALTAGVQNKQFINIGGEGGKLVFLNKDILDGVKNYGKGQEQAIGGDALKNAIDVSDGIDKDTIEVGTMDYGSTLFDRYEKLSALVKAYSEDEKSAAYLGYLAEQQRILDEMKTLGILETIKTPDGKSYEAPVQGMTVDYISLPDIIASGGNISIQTDTLRGAGSMEAKGAPEVTITNNTNLYLKVGNVTVGDPGGEIHFNTVALDSDLSKATDQIKTENSNKDYGVNFSKIALDGDGKTKGKLTIEGNYGGQTVFAKVTIKDNGVEKEQVIQVKPKADIEINGVIQNNDGSVSVTSKANNIVIQGSDASSTAGVKGKDVHLSAAAGSISQGYSDDITSIGGNVQDQYGNQYQTIKDEFNKQYGFENTQYIKDEVKNGKAESGLKGTMIAGEAIYLTAADININGYMQSGYAAYDVTIDDKAQAKIDSLKQQHDNHSLNDESNDEKYTSGLGYLIVEEKDVWDDATGSYKHQLPVYYDPSTDKLNVPDVDAHGGKIYLTGRISSTGNGTIKALDGAYDITVKNNTDKTLQLGKLVSNDVDGLIRITDVEKEKITEMTRKETIIKDLKGNLISNTQGTATTYKPEDGLRYNWTTGQKVTTSKTYQNTIKAGLWGLVETMNEEQLTKFEQSNEPIKKSDDEKITKPNGEYIGKIDNDKVNNSDFSVIYNNTNLKDKTNGPGEPERWSTGFLGWFKWERYTWTRETSTSQQYVASVKADKAINIGFIGNADGKSKIDVTSKGDIAVGNAIAGSNSASTIKLQSTNGSITQNGINMVGDNIELHAATGMNNIGITSIGDTVNLTAQNTTSGAMDITVNGAYGKAGNVQVGSITNTGNHVSLTADGNITKDGTDTAITGSRIDLISKNGTIGTNEKALLVQGGTVVTDSTDSLSASVNAAAKGNINIAQAEGDMRIGRVYSDQGDVTVTVKNGNLVDALPSGETIDRGDTDKLIQKWKDLGLVEGEGAYKEQQERDVTSYKDSVKAEYNRYTALKKDYENNRFSQEEQELYDKYAAAKSQFESLSKEYQTYQNQAIYYADDSNRPKADNYRTTEAYEKALATYNKGKTAFAALQEKCQSYKDANAYIKDSMGNDAYTSYTKPTLTKGGETIQLKTAFDNYSTYTALKDSYGAYKTADDYLASTAAQAHIKELRQAGAQWNQDQLLYAIQDAVINPASGSIEQTIKDPNVKGKNITLHVSGSVGLDSDTPKEISLLNIGSNVEALKQLANADAATVKWDAANHKAIITEKSPIGIQTTSRDGKLTVDAKNNVYISGRTEHNETIDNAINIDKVKTDGDIRIQSKNGITNLHQGNDAALIGKNILLQGGTGNLGKADAMLTLDANGVVQATGQDIYLNQLNGEHALQLKSLGGNGDIVLQSAGDIVSADEEGTAAQGYIRNDDSEGTITLDADGSVGTAGHALRIMNADDKATKQTVSVQADKNVYLQGLSTEGTADAKPQGTLFLKELMTNGTVHVADNGSVQVLGPMTNTGSGDVTIKTEKDITVAGDVTSQAAAILSARGDVNLQSGLLQAKKVNLVGSTVHNPDEQAGAGKITQSANSRINADKVVATAMNGIDLSNKQNTLQWVDVWNMGQGDINIANDGAKDLTVIIEKENHGNVTVHNYKTDGKVSNMSVESQTDASGVVTFQNDAGTITTPTKDTYIGEATGKEVEYKNDFAIHGSHVVVQGTDSVTNMKDIVSKGQQDGPDGTVEITSKKGDIQNGGDITADKNVLFETTGGNITMNGNITAKDGGVTVKTDVGKITTEAGKTISASKDVSLKTKTGTIDVEGTITAGKDATVQTQDGSITVKGDVTANDGYVRATTDKGPIDVEGTIIAGKDAAMQTQDGSITVKGDVTAKDGAIHAGVGNQGDIVINGNALAKDSIIAESQNGKITFDGNARATEGNVSATTNAGDITFAGTVDAKTDIAATTETTGNITMKGNITAKDGNVNTTTHTGDINFAGAVDAKTDIKAATETNGNITFNGAVNAGRDLLANTKTNGGITIRQGATAEKDISLNTNKGDILFDNSNNKAEDIMLQSNAGNVNLNISTDGSIKDTHHEVNGDRGIIHANQGNVTVLHNGIGDVDLQEVYAKGDNKISVADGDLHLVNASGKLVAILVKNPDKKMDVENVEAATQIQIAGSNMDLENITQRKDGDGYLIITPEGTSPDKPINSLKIGNIKTDTGVRFDRLWVNTGDITVNKGAFLLDKVYVLDKATFSNGTVKTNVFGSAPKREEGVTNTFWNNTAINKPQDKLGEWLQPGTNDAWAHLYFTPQGQTQYGNGHLLDLWQDYYVFSKRYTEADWMRILSDDDTYDFYGKYNQPEISYYDRYNLITGDGATASNASKKDISVD